jgi:hypothetical protein
MNNKLLAIPISGSPLAPKEVSAERKIVIEESYSDYSDFRNAASLAREAAHASDCGNAIGGAAKRA